MNFQNHPFVKAFKVAILAAVLITFIQPQDSDAQALRLMASNTVAGATTGATLGGATMALKNEQNWDYLRFGVGFGTIGGLGLGIYDVVQVAGSGYYVDGVFASASNTSSIILMDTFYGGLTGAVVGSAIALMTGDRIVMGLQYGAGVGAWAGFAFGLVDAFIFSTHSAHDDFYDDFDFSSADTSVRGFVQYDSGSSLSIGALSPALYTYSDLGDLTDLQKFSTGVEFAHMKVRF